MRRQQKQKSSNSTKPWTLRVKRSPWLVMVLTVKLSLVLLLLWVSVRVFLLLDQAPVRQEAESSMLDFFLNNARHSNSNSSCQTLKCQQSTTHILVNDNNPLITYDYHRVSWNKAVSRGCTNHSYTTKCFKRKNPRCVVGKTDPCRETCFTEAALDNPLYPFTSLQDQIIYTNTTLPQKLKERKQLCKRQMLQHPQPNNVSWCAWSQQPNPWKDAPKRCSKSYGSGGFSGPFDRMMVFPQHKLAFCGIPKVGITNWIKFLRFVLGANDYLSHPHFKKDKKYFFFDNFQWEQQERILNDPSWTKAVFLRQPAERILSAYKDRIEGQSHKSRVGTNYVDLDFDEFLAKLETAVPDPKNCPTYLTGESWCMDPHWRPQYYSCAMYEHLPNMDFVGSLERGVVANHTRALLERVGLWDSHGRHYDANPPSGGDHVCKVYPNYTTNGEGRNASTSFQPRGFQQSAPRTRHATGAGHQMGDYYTPEAQERVQRIYKHDFALWNALLEEMEERDGGWATGAALAKRLNPQCG